VKHWENDTGGKTQSTFMEQNLSLYYLFHHERGWNRASEFRGQRL